MSKEKFIDNGLQRIRYITGTAIVKRWDTRVLIVNGMFTITLPRVAETKGLIYTFRLLNDGATTTTINADGAETIITPAGSAPNVKLVITGAGKARYVILYSSGVQWYVLGGVYDYT